MASTKDLKKRIGSVKNTQQTTRAMKMVSAAKLRRASDAIHAQRPYARRVESLIRNLTTHLGERLSTGFPLLNGLDPEGEQGAPKVLLVLVTSDRGLAGGFNANVIKAAQRWMQENAGQYSAIDLAFVGRKGHDFFKSRNVGKGPYFSELGGKVTYAKARKLADSLVELYMAGQYHQVKFVFNEFRNAVSQRVAVENYLPLNAASLGPEAGTETGGATEFPAYIVRPEPMTFLNQLLSKHFAIQAFRVMLESQAGEHGARMSAMENATKNAEEMVRKLTLEYNKQRQAGITKELLEIISGTESQKSA